MPQFFAVCETFVEQMKEFLFIHCVFQRTWILRVWTVIAVVRRRCHRVDFWARGVALRLVSFLCLLEFVWVSLRVSSRCWLMRERGVCVQHFPQTGLRNMFVVLGMRSCAAWVEGCSISQRFQC